MVQMFHLKKAVIGIPHAKKNVLLNNVNTVSRILTGKKHRQTKLQRLQKVRIWAFGSLVHQVNFL